MARRPAKSSRPKPTPKAKAKSRLERDENPMPAYVRKALVARGLMRAYRARPAYQQNDYLGWIAGAKLDATKEKRLAQMLEELEAGTLYMKMAWRPLKAKLEP